MSNPIGYVLVNDGGSNIDYVNTSTARSVSATSIATGTTNTTGTDTTNSVNNMASSSSSTTVAPLSKPKPDLDPTPQALFTLPDGRLIDGKNTLQSFDGGNGVTRPVTTTLGDRDGSKMSASQPPPELMLPDGRVIDGKNTLQSFAAPVLVVKAPASNDAFVSVAEQQQSNTIVTNPTGDTTNTGDVAYVEEEDAIHAEAVAVVDADILNSQVAPLHRPKQSNFYLLALAVMIGFLVVGIASFCGTGNCRKSTTPAGSPLALQTTLSPTSTYDQSLSIACNFLNSSDISECQKGTTFTRNAGSVVTIPSEIGLLTQMTSLELDNTELTGKIPSTLGDLILLENLLLNENQLTGTIPSALGNLIMLTALRLDENQLTSTIPSTLGNLTQLTSLLLSKNQLNGTIPSTLTTRNPSTLGDLILLENLQLNENKLTGTIPSTLGNLMKLTELRLDDNQFTSTVPSILGNLTHLTSFRFANNQLNGTVPSTLGNLKQLTLLRFRGNLLTGTIPSTLGQLTQLTSFWVFNNTQLAGTIPSTLCSVSNVDIRIDCANIVCTCCFDDSGHTSCPITAPTLPFAPIQAPISTITSPPTKVPVMSPTTLSSPINAPMPTISLSPTKVPTRLVEEELLVACNFLNISSLSVCQTMTKFDGDSVVGTTIPTELGLLSQLTYLSLIDNQLMGTIPSTLGYLTQLTVLYLTTNQLTGTIPLTLGNLTQLMALSVLENQLSGTIPSTLIQLTQLTYLDLGSNPQLHGEIPSALCTVSGIDIYIDCANITTCTCCIDNCT